jgi:hypothetical protein
MAMVELSEAAAVATYRLICTCRRGQLHEGDRTACYEALNRHAKEARKEARRRARAGLEAQEHESRVVLVTDAMRRQDELEDLEFHAKSLAWPLDEHTRRFAQHLRRRVVDGLRRCAAEVERRIDVSETAAQTSGDPQGGTEPSALASGVQHDVLWMVANLGLDDLTVIAATIETMRLEKRQVELRLELMKAR